MQKVLITGSLGLVGSACARFFASQGWQVHGIDNNGREKFFGPTADLSTIQKALGRVNGYEHHAIDIRSFTPIAAVVHSAGPWDLIIHTAGQPSHEFSMEHPVEDFDTNARATLNLLECLRTVSPKTPFVFLSTNKVYGDSPNTFRYAEGALRYDAPEGSAHYLGFQENQLPVDGCLHTVFGVSKLAADLLTQEYGRYHNMRTLVLRCGCLTGPAHAGTQMHGFLSYLTKCVVFGEPYKVFGYGGKQVRDNLHVHDLVDAIYEYAKAPHFGSVVYNMGGGRSGSCSILEALSMTAECCGIAESKLLVERLPESRKGDHLWWITNTARFQRSYPSWAPQYSIKDTIADLVKGWKTRRG